MSIDKQFLEEALAGLQSEPKSMPCKYLYDERGSQLFDDICGSDDYYVTRADLEVTKTHIAAIADLLGPHVRLVELGSGASAKARLLLDNLHDLACYVPLDISQTQLDESVEQLRASYPDLEILPLCADYHKRVKVPEGKIKAARTVVYYPGSTLGNFAPDDAVPFLTRLAKLTRPNGGILLGIDLKKDVATLERAYDDSQGITAAFNLNLLTRMNRELEADFDLDKFAHRAVFNEELGRVEMHLVSQQAQSVQVGGTAISFAEGETIRTEESYKYTREGFRELVARAGFEVATVWLDKDERFSLQWLVPTTS